MSPLPDVGQMARKSARNDEDRIDPHVVSGLQIARREALRGGDHSTKPPCVERHCGGFRRRTRLYLDECDYSPPSGDDVDLAVRHTSAASEDAPAAQPQPPAGQRLGSAAAPFCSLPIQRLDRSRAIA